MAVGPQTRQHERGQPASRPEIDGGAGWNVARCSGEGQAARDLVDDRPGPQEAKPTGVIEERFQAAGNLEREHDVSRLGQAIECRHRPELVRGANLAVSPRS
jgi:hypothetical protein